MIPSTEPDVSPTVSWTHKLQGLREMAFKIDRIHRFHRFQGTVESVGRERSNRHLNEIHVI